MAADSSIDETEAGAAAGEEKPLREPTAGPPRPPRPRNSGPVRIPLPSSIIPGSKRNGVELAPNTPVPANSNSASIATEEVTTEIATASATPVPPARASRPPAAVITPAVPGDATTNYEFPLTRRSSAAPPLSFDSQDVDPSDRAPIAPLTPWRDVPPLKEPVVERPAAVQNEEDHEDTIVGQVPKNLLELSSEEDENTRAYQAPQELIDLARRQREERRQAAVGSGQERKRSDSLLPAGRLFRNSPSPGDGDQNEICTATVPIDTVPSGDAAPPVARSRPLHAAPMDEPLAAIRASGSGASLAELARAVSERATPESMPVVSREGVPDSSEPSVSSFATPWLTRGRVWLLLVGLFMAIGYALARWRGLDLLLPR